MIDDNDIKELGERPIKKKDNYNPNILTTIEEYTHLDHHQPGRWEIINQHPNGKLILKDHGPSKPTFIDTSFIEKGDLLKIDKEIIKEYNKHTEYVASVSEIDEYYYNPSMTKEQMSTFMEQTFKEIRFLRESGQKEYAHKDDNAFANFERVAERMGLRREQVLLVYLEKHIDGIHSYAQGHRSQREHVSGRIKDVITYLILLRGMIEGPIDEDEEPIMGKGITSVTPNWDKDV